MSIRFIKSKTIIWLVLLTLGVGLEMQGQYSFEGRGHFGFVIPHRSGVDNLILDHVRSFELNAEKETSGNKHWHHQWNFPSVGVHFYAGDLGNPAQLGYCYSLLPYIRFSSDQSRRVMFQLKMGSGIGFVTKAFDPVTNHKNVMIGSRFNISANATGEIKVRISDRSSISTGVTFVHFSNASYKVPNLGINVPSLGLGYTYDMHRLPRTNPADSLMAKGGFEGIVYGTIGIKENYPISSTKFVIYNLSTEVSKRFGYRSKLTAAFDLFYNPSIIPRDIGPPDGLGEMISASQQGVIISYGMVIDKLSLTLGQGIYLRSKYDVESQFYHRICASYLVHKRVALRWCVKTHFFKADNFELGIGYRFL